MTPAHPVAAFVRRLLDGWWRSPMLAVYTDGDRDAAQFRAAHLNSVVRLTPYTMVANIGNGALVVWAYRDDVPLGMLVWLALLYALCVFALLGGWRGRHRPRTMATPAAIRHAMCMPTCSRWCGPHCRSCGSRTRRRSSSCW